MNTLSQRLKSSLLNQGVPLVGITSTELLADGPPSADPRYLLPEARSVVSFALPLNRETVNDFLGKKSWRPHCEDRKATVQRLYKVGDEVAELLRGEGFFALNVDLNNNYRPEEGAAEVTEMTEFHPVFSHRYAALAAGIGRFGWSGNLMTTEYGALVELGSVITSAELSPDAPIPDEEHPCDGCRACVSVCPVGMIEARESTSVRIAGVCETIACKRPNTCCWIGCTGYEGLAANGKWSNWSPYRLGRPLPVNKKELDELCIGLQKADPQMQAGDNSFADYRQAIFNPDWLYYTVCGFCRSVCARDRQERQQNRKRIHGSGTAALRLDGSHVVADENAVEVETPFGLKVLVSGDQLSADENRSPLPPDTFPLDREVIAFLKEADLPRGL